MVRQLRCASLCLLLVWAGLGNATPPGETAPPPAPAPAGPLAAGATPASSAAAVPEPPVPAIPPPARPTPPLGTPEGQGAVAAEQAAAGEENPDWAVTLQRIASSVVSI
ncbi:MAG TPA: hypothetical protein VF764_01440, partial [Steroidobacteraceae bacterium]